MISLDKIHEDFTRELSATPIRAGATSMEVTGHVEECLRRVINRHEVSEAAINTDGERVEAFYKHFFFHADALEKLFRDELLGILADKYVDSAWRAMRIAVSNYHGNDPATQYRRGKEGI